MERIFAGTPQLEAMRALIHEAATPRHVQDTNAKMVIFNDILRAFFEAPAVWNVCVELPDEDLTPADKLADNVSHLKMSLYGTRDAAMNWQDDVPREMTKWGFHRGKFNPCLYYKPAMCLMTVVHGDDFMSVGARPALAKFKNEMQKRFEIKTQVIGATNPEGGACASSGSGGLGGQCVQEGRVLNRVVRRTSEGWEMEPDQRHVDLIIKELGLSEAKPVSTPGEPEIRGNGAENDQVLSAAEASKFRGLAARANYLAADRTDTMYAVKELCRGMARPTTAMWHRLKRRCGLKEPSRYLKHCITEARLWLDRPPITNKGWNDWCLKNKLNHLVQNLLK